MRLVPALTLATAASAVVIATPVYKAAYSGILKAFLGDRVGAVVRGDGDKIPQTHRRCEAVVV